MNDLARDLYFLMEDRCSGEVESPACRSALRDFDRELDEVQVRTDRILRDSLYSTALLCINEAQYAAFRLGLAPGPTAPSPLTAPAPVWTARHSYCACP